MAAPFWRFGVLRWETRRDAIRECGAHDLRLTIGEGWNATEHCSRCPYQQPAMDYIRERNRLLMQRCPSCGKRVPD